MKHSFHSLLYPSTQQTVGVVYIVLDEIINLLRILRNQKNVFSHSFNAKLIHLKFFKMHIIFSEFI